MLKIGEFSKLSRVSVRMLRHYDQKGLLTPSEIDPMTGYRYYSENQLSQVCRITALKDLGFSLAAIREILGLRPIREFDLWLEKMGISENGRLTSRAGDPTIFLNRKGRG